MDDAPGDEDRVDTGDAPRLIANGDYLCVQHEDQLRYIYRRVPAGATPHPLVSYTRYGGELYSLVWVEDDA